MTERLVARGCITCGEEAVPMRVLEVDRPRGLALCSAPEGVHSSVEIALVEPVARGEVLLVHAGTALGRAAVERAPREGCGERWREQAATAFAADAERDATSLTGEAEQVETALTAAVERRSRA